MPSPTDDIFRFLQGEGVQDAVYDQFFDALSPGVQNLIEVGGADMNPDGSVYLTDVGLSLPADTRAQILGLGGGEDQLARDRFGFDQQSITRDQDLAEREFLHRVQQDLFDRARLLQGSGGGLTPFQTASLTGFLNGNETLDRQAFGEGIRQFNLDDLFRNTQADRDFQLASGDISGIFGGSPTLAAQLGFGGLNLDRDLGFGRLGLDRTLGLGRLGLDQRALTQDANQFGQSLAFQGEQAGLDRALQSALGFGNLNLGRDRLGLDRTLGLGDLSLGRDRLGLDTELGRGALDLDRLRTGIDLVRNPSHFIASQLVARGPGATVGDLLIPGGVSDLLGGGGDVPIRTGRPFAPPSLQQVSQSTGPELEAAFAAVPFLSGGLQTPEQFSFGIENLGLRGF